MTHIETQCSRLFADLEKAGWHRRSGFLYAPYETMWLLISEPWTGDIQDFHDRMVGRLRLVKNLRAYRSESDQQKGVNDMTDLIQVLHTMISDEGHAA
jgi:hypothetical protein